jgi:hypothetical protein
VAGRRGVADPCTGRGGWRARWEEATGDGRHSAADVLDAIAPTLPITIAPAAVVIPGRRGPVGIPVEDQLMWQWSGSNMSLDDFYPHP